MPDLPFVVGDEITLGGVCRHGVIDLSAPHDCLQLWRVKRIDADRVILQPMIKSGVVDGFNDAAGEFRIVLGP